MLQALTMGHTHLFIHGDDITTILELLVELIRIQVKRQVAHEDNLFHSAFESSRWSFTVTHIADVDVVVYFSKMQNREVVGEEATDEELYGHSINLSVVAKSGSRHICELGIPDNSSKVY